MPAMTFRRGLAAAILSFSVLGAGTVPAMAQGQAAVYDPQPPPDSAYIRFVNTLGEELAVRPAFLPAQRLGTKPEERVTQFAVAQRVGGRELTLEASAGRRTGRATLKLNPGSFNTILVQAQGDGGLEIKAIVDESEFNRARSRLSFYNAVPDCPTASALLAPSGPAVLEGVAPGTAKARSVNPVTAAIRAQCGSQAAPDFQISGLEAGGMYSIWLMRPDGKNLMSFISRDTTARWRG
ncbi:alginate O-acetyltransferase AlgF [Roseomonas indoligenes]|uniref:Alginate O-acetyltransferase AlgF n=1 Tax=Roseomonas indoligenes TaxID=2820811 RepID=A0A940N014_9PROT|nr:alginate O-acetyltransferase AlgF [Pararoseomonas indoligenes]MBP0494783.1 alginate O-acetyltransferase AlgF [Pararoseomonas indoligenes]